MELLNTIFEFLNIGTVNSIVGIMGIIVTIGGWKMTKNIMKKFRKKSRTAGLLGNNGKKPNSKTKNIPAILPLLPDFKEQEDELNEVIQHWNYEGLCKADKHLPLLCILYGDVDEDAELMERLERYFAVQLNNNDYNSIEQVYIHSNDFIKSIHLDSTHFHKTPDFQREIWKRLKEKVIASYSRMDWKEQLILKFSSIEHPIFVYTTLNIVDWQVIDKTNIFIEQFIHFWYQEWSEYIIQEKLDFNYPIVMCLLFHYDKKTQKKFFKKKKTFQLPHLNFSQFSSRYEAYGTILPELASVEKNHVMAWLINYKDTICEHCDIEKVREEIEKLYSKSTHIPMKILASELKRILEMA